MRSAIRGGHGISRYTIRYTENQAHRESGTSPREAHGRSRAAAACRELQERAATAAEEQERRRRELLLLQGSIGGEEAGGSGAGHGGLE